MLKKLRLKNFKLHEDTTIEASRITVFIGPNNSGKSSIFQALLALKQAASWGGDNFCYDANKQPWGAEHPYTHMPRVLIETGPFDALVRKGSREITIELKGSIPVAESVEIAGPVSVNVELRLVRNALAFHKGEVDWGYDRGYHWHYIGAPSAQASGSKVGFGDYEFDIHPSDRFSLAGMSGYRTLALGKLVPNDAFLRAKAAAEALAGAPSRLVQSVHPVYATRGFEELGYPLPKAAPPSLDWPDLADRAIALAAEMVYNPDLAESISDQLADLAELRVQARPMPDYRVVLQATRVGSGPWGVLLAHEGSGVGQLPFVLLPILLAPRGETMLISEPEAHLHPKWQSKLTGLLLKAAKRMDGQFFIETHSEHVLHRLLHAVAKGDLAREDLTIYYFPEPSGGKADPRPLKIDEQGGVEGGLPGFFDQSLDELTEYLEALKQPKK